MFQLFNGNTDRYTVVRHILEEPIIARFVRIQPKTWYRHISMRAEFYGCTKGLLKSTLQNSYRKNWKNTTNSLSTMTKDSLSIHGEKQPNMHFFAE